MKVFLFLFISAYLADAYKIFIYNPKFTASHVIYMGKMADILVKAGHDVTVYLPIVDKDITTNGTQLAKIIVRDFDTPTYRTATDEMQAALWMSENEQFSLKRFLIDKFSSTISPMDIAMGSLCEKQLNDGKLINSLKEERFDLAIGEPFDLCFYGLLKLIGIKNYITVTSCGFFEPITTAFGIPSMPSFVPNFLSYIKTPMTYLERVTNLYQVIWLELSFYRQYSGKTIDVLKNRFGEGFDFGEEIGNSALYYVSIDEHVDFPRPISPNLVYIGGIHKVQAKPLEKKFNEIMENSKRGVILVSFGTAALSHMMPQEVKQIFLKAFKTFPEVTFLWKYEKDEHKIADGIPNVVTANWVPQNDLLEHPKLLAFISHGGMNSVQESSSKGVPMIMIPLMADQYRNSKMLEYRKMAIALNLKELTVEKLTNAIKSILEDDSYRKNAKRIANLIAEKPMSAEERVVKYTEFATKYGLDLNLDMYGRHLNFIEFYCLDIIIPAILLVLLSLYSVYRLVRLVLRKFLMLFSGNKLKDD